MKTVYLDSKKAHKDAVISTASLTNSDGRKAPHLIFSSGDDGLVKLWDLRAGKAVKLFRHPGIKCDSRSNIVADAATAKLYMTCDTKLLTFDIGCERLVSENISEQPISHDFINHIDLKGSTLAYVDDE